MTARKRASTQRSGKAARKKKSTRKKPAGKAPKAKPRRGRIDFDGLRRIATALPGVEEGTSYGTPAFKLRKKLLLRMWKDGDTAVLACDPDDRDMLLEARPDVFFVTDHYAGHPYILTRLSQASRDDLAERLEAAWRRHANKREREAFDAGG